MFFIKIGEKTREYMKIVQIVRGLGKIEVKPFNPVIRKGAVL